MSDYYTTEELKRLGVKAIGENVRVSTKASIYTNNGIVMGNNVRVDDFCILVGDIEIHSYIHIGAFCGLHASQGGRIVFEDFSGISSNVNIYASSDSFEGEYCTARPGLPDECIKTVCSEVRLGKYSQIGTGSTVIPGGSLGEGTAVGAMSLVNKQLESWSIYAGVPCCYLKKRSQNMLTKIDTYVGTEV